MTSRTGKQTALLSSSIPIPLNAEFRAIAASDGHKISYHLTRAIQAYVDHHGADVPQPAAPAPAPARRPRLAAKPLQEAVPG